MKQLCATVSVCVRRAAAVKMLTVVNRAFPPQTPNPHFRSGRSGSTPPKYMELLSQLSVFSLFIRGGLQALSRQPPALYSHDSTHSHLRAATVQHSAAALIKRSDFLHLCTAWAQIKATFTFRGDCNRNTLSLLFQISLTYVGFWRQTLQSKF